MYRPLSLLCGYAQIFKERLVNNINRKWEGNRLIWHLSLWIQLISQTKKPSTGRFNLIAISIWYGAGCRTITEYAIVYHNWETGRHHVKKSRKFQLVWKLELPVWTTALPNISFIQNVGPRAGCFPGTCSKSLLMNLANILCQE